MSSLLKAVEILNAFSPHQSEWKVADLSLELGIPVPTLYRILSTLTKTGLLEKKQGDNTYVIGRSLYITGSLYLLTTDLFHAAEPVLQAVNNITGEATNVCILDDNGYIVRLLREESKHSLRHVVHVGSASPAYANAAGKALLSVLPDEGINRLYPEEKLKKLTSKTVSTKAELKRELEQIRENGYAFISEQAYVGVEAFAALIHDARGNVIAATTIAVPTARMNKEKRKIFCSLAKIESGLISYQLGYQDRDQQIHRIADLYTWWQQNHADEIL